MSEFHDMIARTAHEIPKWALAISRLTGVDRDDVDSWALGSSPSVSTQEVVSRVCETALRLEGLRRTRDWRAVYTLCHIAEAGDCIPSEIARLPFRDLRTVFGWAWVLVRDRVLDRTDIDVDWMIWRMSEPSLWTLWFDRESYSYALDDESPRLIEAAWGDRFWFVQTLPSHYLDVAVRLAAHYTSLWPDEGAIVLKPDPRIGFNPERRES